MSKGTLMFRALAVGCGVVLGVIVVSASWPKRGATVIGDVQANSKSTTTASTTSSSGKIEQDLPSYTGLGLSIPGNWTLIQGEREAIVIEGDAKTIDELEVIVKGPKVEVRNKSRNWNYNTKDVKGTVYFKNLDSVGLASSGRVDAGAINASDIRFSIAGSADLKIDKLAANEVKFSVAGSGNLDVGGNVKAQQISIAGSGDVRTHKLKSESVKVSIAGSGNAKVWATQSLKISVAGSGDVGYYGKPSIEKSIVGSGDVTALGDMPS
jgi:hypothetical protein